MLPPRKGFKRLLFTGAAGWLRIGSDHHGPSPSIFVVGGQGLKLPQPGQLRQQGAEAGEQEDRQQQGERHRRGRESGQRNSNRGVAIWILVTIRVYFLLAAWYAGRLAACKYQIRIMT
jgi:hypothetical protein